MHMHIHMNMNTERHALCQRMVGSHAIASCMEPMCSMHIV